MKLEIVGITSRGKPNQEHLVLRANSDLNLQYYVVFDTTYVNPQAISNIQRHAYWFPPKTVKAGDLVLLITGKGVNSQAPLQPPYVGTAHFFYWGLDRTIWNNTGDCAVVFEVNSWQTTPYV
jgi:hypothetical protein